MPFCPECKTEYTEGVTVCADCQAALTPELPPEEAVAYVDWEVVHEIPNEVIGNLIQGVLEDEGIDAVVRPHEIGALAGIRFESEWGEILVHRDDLQQAKEIIQAYLATQPESQSEDRETDLEAV